MKIIKTDNGGWKIDGGHIIYDLRVSAYLDRYGPDTPMAAAWLEAWEKKQALLDDEQERHNRAVYAIYSGFMDITATLFGE